MKDRSFTRNIFGVSLMYDAVFFIVLVSLSGVVLLPALKSNVAVNTSVETHREHIADDALKTFLGSRADIFSYRIGANILDDAVKNLGIDNSSDGLYGAITTWLLAHEQRHKTYANLIAENLACQFHIPFSVLGVDRLNIFTQDYDHELQQNIAQFFTRYLGEKYDYNVTALWHPIKGVRFGGELFVGEHPPTINSHVAQSTIIIPYKPEITIRNTTIIFTKHWVKHELFGDESGLHFWRSSILALANISIIFENYTAHTEASPFHDHDVASEATKENVSTLVYGFLLDGIQNESNVTLFPGIYNMTITYGFTVLKNAIRNFSKDMMDEFIGDAWSNVNDVFSGLNESSDNPLAEGFLEEMNNTLQTLLNTSIGSLSQGFDTIECILKENVTRLVHSYLDPAITYFVDKVFDAVDLMMNFVDMLCDWLFDHISINKAEVMLTIWEVR